MSWKDTFPISLNSTFRFGSDNDDKNGVSSPISGASQWFLTEERFLCSVTWHSKQISVEWGTLIDLEKVHFQKPFLYEHLIK